MQISWVVPTYNEASVIDKKLRNLISFCKSHGVFSESEFIVADNGSSDNTVDIAGAFTEVTVMDYGRVGKYQAVYNAVAHSDSDWIVLSDANVMLRSCHSESLDDLFYQDDVVLVYGLIRRAAKPLPNSLPFPVLKTPKRLLLDSWFGNSSGAYGGLYAVRTRVLKKAISLPPVQNDDYFIAVASTQHGIPKVGRLYAEEIESMSFRDEFSRKMRDAQGHVQAIIEINKRVRNTRARLYGLAVRGLIWSAIISYLALNALILFKVPAFFVVLAPALFFEKVRMFYARSVGFLVGFLSGPFLEKKIIWETTRK